MTYKTSNVANVPVDEFTSIIEKNAYDPTQTLQPLYDRIGDARIVMLGEASHGTHEYYLWRARITKHLISEKDFNFIAVEGDWPASYAINRYIRDYVDSGNNVQEVLQNFNRWPTWMWSNWEISALMTWLKTFNENKGFHQQIGFYGLDVYSLWESLEAITDYLRKNDPEALQSAMKAMECFEPHNRDESDYAASTRFTPDSCEQEVVELLKQIRTRVPYYDTDPEAPFNTEQNALVAVNAEEYYRAMMRGGGASWNVRDQHMMETLERLLDFHGPDSKAIVWEHNTHIGDAKATTMYNNGMVNIGQLSREEFGRDDTVLVGFGSYKGSVIAGDSWGSRMRKMKVPPARKNSWEHFLHQASPQDKLILTEDLKNTFISEYRWNHRAIGVVYHPESEHFGNYVPSDIPNRYDAFIYIDETRALHPIAQEPDYQKVPETYPWEI